MPTRTQSATPANALTTAPSAAVTLGLTPGQSLWLCLPPGSVLHASQVSNGEENALKIYVYGELGGLEWHQMEPNTLIHKTQESQRIIRPNVGEMSASAKAHIRLPAGHPEGFFEAFANVYRNFAFAVKAHMAGQPADPLYDFPGVTDGVRGLAFIDTVIASNQSSEKWTAFSE